MSDDGLVLCCALLLRAVPCVLAAWQEFGTSLLNSTNTLLVDAAVFILGGTPFQAVQLTPTNTPTATASAAWFQRPINIRQGFDATWTVTKPDARPSEGFAFVIQWNDAGTNVSGLETGITNGRTLGYNFNRSLAVEFDFWDNSAAGSFTDSAAPHVQVHSNWENQNTANNSAKLPSTANAMLTAVPTVSGTYYFRVLYVPSTSSSANAGTLSVFMGATSITMPLVQQVDINIDNMERTFPKGQQQQQQQQQHSHSDSNKSRVQRR